MVLSQIYFPVYRIGTGGPSSAVTWIDLKRSLSSLGEAISAADLEIFVKALLGDNAALFDKKNEIDVNIFIRDLLGFEDV